MHWMGLVVNHRFLGESQINGFDLFAYERANPIELFGECRVDAEISHVDS
jgi:hypothetical protein